MPTGDAPVDGDLEAPPCRYRGNVPGKYVRLLDLIQREVTAGTCQ
jgi:hypothetical protein